MVRKKLVRMAWNSDRPFLNRAIDKYLQGRYRNLLENSMLKI